MSCPPKSIFPKGTLMPNSGNQSKAMKQSQTIQQNNSCGMYGIKTGAIGATGATGASLIYYSDSDNIFLVNETQSSNSLVGNSNTAIGYNSGDGNTGNNNIFLGYNSGVRNTGDNNIFLGPSSGDGNTGNNNIFLGPSSGAVNRGDNNIIIGSTQTDATIYSNNITLSNNNGEPTVLNIHGSENSTINMTSGTNVYDVQLKSNPGDTVGVLASLNINAGNTYINSNLYCNPTTNNVMDQNCSTNSLTLTNPLPFFGLYSITPSVTNIYLPDTVNFTRIIFDIKGAQGEGYCFLNSSNLINGSNQIGLYKGSVYLLYSTYNTDGTPTYSTTLFTN